MDVLFAGNFRMVSSSGDSHTESDADAVSDSVSVHRPLPMPNERQYAPPDTANALKAGKYLRINVLNVNASIYSAKYLISPAPRKPRAASRMSLDKWLDK